jgi:hypothetical protein
MCSPARSRYNPLRKTVKASPAKLVEKLQAESDRKAASEINQVKKLRTAQAILSAEPEVQAAVVQSAIRTVSRLGAVRPTLKPRWVEKKAMPWAALQLLGPLLRKNPPLEQADLASFFDQIAGIGLLDSTQIHFAPLVSHVEELAAREPLQPLLIKSLANLAHVLTGSKLPRIHARLWQRWEWAPSTSDAKLADRIERLLAGTLNLGSQRGAKPESVVDQPVHAGAPGKSAGGREEARREAETLVRALGCPPLDKFDRFEKVATLPATKNLLSAKPGVQIEFIRLTLATVANLREKLGSHRGRYWNLSHEDGYPGPAVDICRRLFRRKLPFADADVLWFVERLADLGIVTVHAVPVVENVVALLESHFAGTSPGETFRKAMERLQIALNDVSNAPEQKLRRRINALMTGPISFTQATETHPGEATPNFVMISKTKPKSVPKPDGPPPRVFLHPGEAWSDAAIVDLKAAPPEKQQAWLRLLAHCQGASGGMPNEKWRKTARELFEALGAKDFNTRVLSWFPLVNQPRTQPIAEWLREYQPDPNQLILEPHSDLLKGLAWCCGLKKDEELARALTALALSAYRKIPHKGPREVKVGNACVTALGMMPGMEGVYQLALLKVRVKFGTAQKFVENSLDAAAERSGVPRSELEEMAVPAYGLTEVGRCTEEVGDYIADLTVTGTDSTSLTWLKPDGKRQTSIPPVVREKFGDDLKELQSAAKDIQRMLPAQRERIDNMFREQKTWPFDTWRERYLDHPLVGVLARRLIWEFTSARKTTAGIFFNGVLVDLGLRPLQSLRADSSVHLWHPIGKDAEEIVAWRSWLDAQQIQQPFKQAHREVYLLTDAERGTRTYSNRFAAHILRQHQFNALCAARGWKNKLRLMVDAEFPPATVYLPKWNLRAEFWIEGIGGDYGADTNDAGVYLRLSTDQVRFYRMEAAQRSAHASGGGYHPGYGEGDAVPLPLEEIPPLVFSEVMRDVDLFVGVASVGNDPTWNDGGPDGRYRQYWQEYSFGELSASAKTRKDVLERLVPKLKIAGRCSFRDRFLVVQGSIRTYQIHLGSGNILMEPNDQYLCIVPRQGEKEDSAVALPFEGDRTLSIIISKAFLLAADDKIKDQTILNQIKSR